MGNQPNSVVAQKKSVKNLRFWSILALILIIVFGFLYFDVAGSIKTPIMDINIGDKLAKFKKEEAILKELLENQNLNRELKDSIARMLLRRQLDVSKAEELASQMRVMSALTSAEKEALLQRVHSFLSPDINKDVDIDYGFLAQEKVKSYLQGRLNSAEHRERERSSRENGLMAEIQSLTDRLNIMSSEQEFSEKRYNQLNAQYNDLLEKQSSIKPNNSEDSLIMAKEITKLKNELDLIGKALIDAKVASESFVSVSVANARFEPIKSKQNAKGIYFKKFDVIKYTFLPKPTNIKYNGSEVVRLKLVFTIPKSTDEWHNIVKFVDVKLNELETVKIVYGIELDKSNKPIEFSDGMYTVQVFLASNDNAIEPIDWSKFEYKKGLF